jgi:lysophospholipase L1-like esterase
LATFVRHTMTEPCKPVGREFLRYTAIGWVASYLLLLCSCGTQSGGGSLRVALQPDLHRDPVVVFIGDQITANWPFANPLWINKAVAGQTSAETLAGLQAVIDLHPDIIHLITGTQDALNDPNGALEESGPVIANITVIVQQTQIAGIKIIVGTEPPGVQGSEDVPHPPLDLDISLVNSWLLNTLAEQGNVTVVNYFIPLSPPGCGILGFCGWAAGLTTDGVSPNATGYAVMTRLVLAAIQAQRTGGNK